MKLAIRDLTRCPKVQQDLLKRIDAGKVWIYPDDGWTNGTYIESEDIIYISNFLWNETGGLKSKSELAKFLTHEGVHAWFGAKNTDDSGGPGSNPYHNRGMEECF